MPTSLSFGTGTIYAFLLVLSRIAGAFVMVPIPGASSGADLPRIFAALAITIALLPSWPVFNSFPDSLTTIIVAVLGEAVFGLAIGIAVACLTEIMKMAGQIMSTQAGFGYASVVDPNTSADAGLLVVAAQLTGALLFLALGLDREVVRVFATSLTTHPPGSFQPDHQLTEALWRFGSDIFSAGVRLALPSIALLGLVDISLGLLGRINSQLQLITISFPLKMLTALLLIALLAFSYPRIIGSAAGAMLQISRRAAAADVHGR